MARHQKYSSLSSEITLPTLMKRTPSFGGEDSDTLDNQERGKGEESTTEETDDAEEGEGMLSGIRKSSSKNHGSGKHEEKSKRWFQYLQITAIVCIVT